MVIWALASNSLFFFLWWLIYVSTWVGHEEHWFFVCLFRVFRDETGIWIGGLSEVDCLLQCGWASSNPIRAWREQGAKEEEICLLLPAAVLELGHLTSSSPTFRLGFTSFAVLLFEPSNLDWIIPLAFLGLYVANSRWWDSLAFIIRQANSSQYISFLYPIGSLSLRNPD